MTKEFTKSERGFDYFYTDTVAAGASAYYVKVPDVSKNKRSISDIGYMADDGVKIYATIDDNIETTDLWKELNNSGSINKTVTGFKIDNSSSNSSSSVAIRIIFES